MVVQAPTKRVTINLPPLLPWQQEVEDDPARFKVLDVGRRSGKTHYGVYKCTKEALNNPNSMYWWVAPIYSISDIGWRLFKRRIIIPLQNAGLSIKIREDPRYVEFTNGSSIWIKSADNPDSLRGEGLSGIVLDEAAQLKEEVWAAALGPSLADKQGWAVFITTPKGKNWVYNLYNYAKNADGWASWKLKTRDINPYITKEEIDFWYNYYLERGQLHIFYQEWEADFGASQHQVYSDFGQDSHLWRWNVPEFDVVRGGLDFGGTTISSHKSAGSVGILTPKDELLLIDEFEQAGPNIAERQMNWMWEAEQKIRDLGFKTKHRIDKVIWHADKTQMVGIQLMRQMGFTVIPSKGGPDSVIEGVEMVHRRLKVREDGHPRLYVYPGLHYTIDAFERYRYPESTSEDKPLAQKPLKVNDDLMDATRYLIEGLDRSIIGDPAILYKNALPSIGNTNQFETALGRAR